MFRSGLSFTRIRTFVALASMTDTCEKDGHRMHSFKKVRNNLASAFVFMGSLTNPSRRTAKYVRQTDQRHESILANYSKQPAWPLRLCMGAEIDELSEPYGLVREVRASSITLVETRR
jgi:hypothetical protein